MAFTATNDVPIGAINSTTGSNGNGHFLLRASSLGNGQPVDPTMVQIYSAGSLLTLGVHYLLGGNNLDFISGFYPLAGDGLVADYTWDVVPPAVSFAPAIAPSNTLQLITDHIAQAQNRLLTQYRDKPNFLKLIAVFAGRTQVVENAIWSVYTGRKLANAIGAQLDGIGRIVGLARSEIPQAADDEVYRVWLKSWIAINFSSGTKPDLIALFTAVAAPGTLITVKNSGLASIRVQLGGVAQTQGPTLVSVLGSIRAGGIHATMDYLAHLPAFGFDGAGAGMDAGYFGSSV